MTLSDGKLEKFFSTQKIGTFDALKQKGKVQNLSPKQQPQKIHENIVEKDTASTPLAIREDTVSKEIALQKHLVSNQLHIQEQTTTNPVATPLAESVVINLENDTFNPNIDLQLSTYSRKERELLDLIFWQCHNNCSLISPTITTEQIREALKVNPERVRNLVFRITKKGGLTIKMSKSNQNACRIFELSKPLYQHILESNKRVALITGAAAGIGKEIARKCIKMNMKVVLPPIVEIGVSYIFFRLDKRSKILIKNSERVMKELETRILLNNETIDRLALFLSEEKDTKALKSKRSCSLITPITYAECFKLLFIMMGFVSVIYIIFIIC